MTISIHFDRVTPQIELKLREIPLCKENLMFVRKEMILACSQLNPFLGFSLFLNDGTFKVSESSISEIQLISLN